MLISHLIINVVHIYKEFVEGHLHCLFGVVHYSDPLQGQPYIGE